MNNETPLVWPTLCDPEPPPPPQTFAVGAVLIVAGTTHEDATRQILEMTLANTGHSFARAAKVLGVSVKTIYNWRAKFRNIK